MFICHMPDSNKNQTLQLETKKQRSQFEAKKKRACSVVGIKDGRRTFYELLGPQEAWNVGGKNRMAEKCMIR